MRTFIHAWVEKRLLGLDDHRNEAEPLIELLAVGLYLGLDEQVHKLGKLLIRNCYQRITDFAPSLLETPYRILSKHFVPLLASKSLIRFQFSSRAFDKTSETSLSKLSKVRWRNSSAMAMQAAVTRALMEMATRFIPRSHVLHPAVLWLRIQCTFKSN